MNSLKVFVALLTLFSAGFGLSMLLLDRKIRLSLVSVFAHSWLLGTAFFSLALSFAGLFIPGPIVQSTMVLISIALGLLGLRALKRDFPGVKWPRPHGRLEWFLSIIFAIQILVTFWLAFHRALGWDGLLVWEIKARFIFLNNGGIPSDYFTDPTLQWSHPEYPLYLSSIEAWLYFWIGNCDQSWVRIIFPIFYTVGAAFLYSAITRLTQKRWLGLLGATTFFFIPYLLFGVWNLFTGYADFPLAIFYLAAAATLLIESQYPSSRNILLLAVFTGCMPWIKREGAVLWLCMMGITIGHLLFKKRVKWALLVALPGMLTLFSWLAVCKLFHTLPNPDFMPVTIATLEKNATRSSFILQNTSLELLDLHHWSLLWPSVVTAIACLWWRGQRQLGLYTTYCIAVPLALYMSTYIFSNWMLSYTAHFYVTIARLILQITPFAFLVVFLAVNVERKVESAKN